MPPAARPSTVTSLLDDGRYLHRIRQSWLNTFLDCPEKARRSAGGELDRWETDAALVGSAMHAAIEDVIRLDLEHGIHLGVDDAVGLFDQAWNATLVEFGDEIRWVKRKEGGARAYGRKATTSWATYWWPTMVPFATELAFGPLRIHEDDRRVIEITGTIDYLDAVLGLEDWKTAGRKYEPWEKQRWGAQPPIYVMALQQLVAEGDERLAGYEGPTDAFTYVVMVDDKYPEPQVIEAPRATLEWRPWQIEQLLSITPLLESDIGVWPKRDQHALCSPKFCEAWDTCKGASIVTPKWATYP